MCKNDSEAKGESEGALGEVTPLSRHHAYRDFWRTGVSLRDSWRDGVGPG